VDLARTNGDLEDSDDNSESRWVEDLLPRPQVSRERSVPGVLAGRHDSGAGNREARPRVDAEADQAPPSPLVQGERSCVVELDELFAALGRSAFRRQFRLGAAELDYLTSRGIETVLTQAESLIAQRLAPAVPTRDGKQTPWRGHPVFVAQHATATCCRGCLEKYHGIVKGAELTNVEQAHVIAVLGRWLASELRRARAAAKGAT
jgi:predicted Fe-S protein YdhL (DUF1289 family)